MNRWFPRSAREGLIGPAVVVLLGAACSPSSPVKPGAPVLMSLIIVDGSGQTAVTDTTGECAPAADGGALEGSDCDPMSHVCRDMAKMTICHCVAKPMGDCSIDMSNPATGGTMSCSYGPQAMVVAAFDRLLDTDPLQPGDAGDLPTDIASVSSNPAQTIGTATDYTSTGSTTGLVFPNFAGINGPTLTVSGTPALPAAATVSFALNPARVLAKDGKTQFMGGGLLVDGTISFKTNAFGVSITVPMAPPPPPPPPPDAGSDDGGADGGVADAATDDGGAADAGPPPCVPPPPPPAPLPVPPGMDAVTLTFNNPVDDTTITSHIKVLVGAAVLVEGTDYTIDATMSPTFTITPKLMWRANAMITITVDATAADVFGDALMTPQSASFTTSAM
jgi:hypothetical protein